MVDLLLRRNGLSFQEINEEWKQSNKYEKSQKSLTERTFSRDKQYIADCFGLDIDYSHVTKTHFISNKEEVADDALFHYLLGAFHVRALDTLAVKHRNRVMLQDIPTGVEHLGAVLKAMDEGKTVSFFYQPYASTEKRDKLNVIPCFVRMFEGRWYLIAEYLDGSNAWVYALERMQEVLVGTLSPLPPKSNPETYYLGCFGIIREEKKPVTIKLKVYDQQVNYLRSLPLHDSQEEIETQPNYSVFSYYLRPSFDFMQKNIVASRKSRDFSAG